LRTRTDITKQYRPTVDSTKQINVEAVASHTDTVFTWTAALFIDEYKKAKQQNAICTCYETGRPPAFVGHGAAATRKSTNQDIIGLRTVGLL